jgi:hypothetical protein
VRKRIFQDENVTFFFKESSKQTNLFETSLSDEKKAIFYLSFFILQILFQK